MKHALKKYLLAGAVLMVVASCKKNNIVIDQDPLIPAEAARFVLYPTSTATKYFDYYILDNPAPGSVYKIPVGVTNKSTVDRKVKFTYTTNAVVGTHYTAPAELIIPAGSTLDTLTIQGLFAGYPIGRKDTLKVKITAGDGFIKPQAFQDSVLLIMQKYCNVVLANLGGNYDNTFEGTYGPYTSSVINLTSTGATTATGTLTNVYDSGITANNVTFDWTNPAAFRVTIPEQNTGLTSSGYQIWIRTNGTASTFSSCANTITLRIDLIAKTAGGTVAGYFAQNYLISMAK